MLLTKTLPANLGHILNHPTFPRRAIKGQPLIKHDNNEDLKNIDQLASHLFRLNDLIPKIEEMLLVQEKLTLSAKAFHLSKDKINLAALEKDLTRTKTLKESLSFDPKRYKNILDDLSTIEGHLQNLIIVITAYNFSYQSLDEFKSAAKKIPKELHKLLKKINGPVVLAH